MWTGRIQDLHGYKVWKKRMDLGGLNLGGQIVHCILGLLTHGGQLSDGCGK
jgi:hypothetical protein